MLKLTLTNIIYLQYTICLTIPLHITTLRRDHFGICKLHQWQQHDVKTLCSIEKCKQQGNEYGEIVFKYDSTHKRLEIVLEIVSLFSFVAHIHVWSQLAHLIWMHKKQTTEFPNGSINSVLYSPPCILAELILLIIYMMFCASAYPK